MHIFILRKKRFSPFQDVYKEQIYKLMRIGSNIENTETLIEPGEMAIYTVPPKPPKLVHTKLVCSDLVMIKED